MTPSFFSGGKFTYNLGRMKMRISITISVVCFGMFLIGCGAPGGGNSANSARANAATANAAPATNANANSEAAVSANLSKDIAATPKCDAVKMPGKTFVKDQSFPLVTAEFPRGCFVTFADTEAMVDKTDVPRGSTFYIYEDGEKKFEFPDAFGGQSACWVEAVKLVDLNGDSQKDVIVAGRCLAAKDSYPTNAVYVNHGKGFTTDEGANTRLDDLMTAKAIEDYVTAHRKEFFAE